MTVADGPVAPLADDRAADLVVARLHLRLGLLGLARTELEVLAGRNLLDPDGIRDLAEARWRTGDLAGAGDAAAVILEDRPDDVIALVVAAEIQVHLGRPAEARRLANRAIAAYDGPIDAIFAGMPRGSVWPVDPGAPIEPAGTLFAELAAPLPLVPGAPAAANAAAAASQDAVAQAGAGPGADEDAARRIEPLPVDAPGLWGHSADTVAPVLPDPGELLTRARAALDGDRPGQAAAGLALALRAEPSLAPAVLDLLAGRIEPVLALVRGDAHTIVGHIAEALRDYVAAVDAIDAQRRSDDRRGRHDRATDVVPASTDDADRAAHREQVDAAARAEADAARTEADADGARADAARAEAEAAEAAAVEEAALEVADQPLLLDDLAPPTTDDPSAKETP